MRRIIVTEAQVKSIVDYVISEQTTVTNTEKGESTPYNISSAFASGQYKLTNTSEIDNAISSILNDIKKYPENQEFAVKIEASESKVPNSGVGLKPGDLSRLRSEAVQTYISSKLPKNIKINIVDKGAQGPEWDIKKGAKDPEYTKYQYVTLTLSASGQKTTVVTIAPQYCEQKMRSTGKYGNPLSGFIAGNPTTVDLGPGTGKMKILVDPVSVPDIFIAEYNGKTISTGLLGDSDPYYRLMIGVILGNYYASKEKPWWLKDLRIEEIEPRMASKIVRQAAENADVNDLAHVFKGVQVGPSMFKDNESIIKPYILSEGQIKGYNQSGGGWENSSWSIKIDKIAEATSLKFYTIGMVGQTRWSARFSCGSK